MRLFPFSFFKNKVLLDTDGDGVVDSLDAFPNDPNYTTTSHLPYLSLTDEQKLNDPRFLFRRDFIENATLIQPENTANTDYYEVTNIFNSNQNITLVNKIFRYDNLNTENLGVYSKFSERVQFDSTGKNVINDIRIRLYINKILPPMSGVEAAILGMTQSFFNTDGLNYIEFYISETWFESSDLKFTLYTNTTINNIVVQRIEIYMSN